VQRGAWVLQRIRPEVEGFDDSSSAPNDGKGNDHNDSRHFTCVLLREDGWVHALKFHGFGICEQKD